MKPPVALLAEALDYIEEAQTAVQQSSLAQSGYDVQSPIALLEQAHAALEQTQNQHLQFLGLPPHYVRTTRIRLKKEASSWKLWLPALLFLVIALWGISLPRLEFEFLGAKIVLSRAIVAICFVAILLVVHEGLHALPLIWLGRNQPGFKLRFGFFGLGAYATGNCLLPRTPFLIVTLMPLVVITVLGILLWILVPSWAPWLYLLIVVNAAGAWGDLYVSWRLMRAHPQAMGMDTDYEMAIFEPKPGVS